MKFLYRGLFLPLEDLCGEWHIGTNGRRPLGGIDACQTRASPSVIFRHRRQPREETASKVSWFLRPLRGNTAMILEYAIAGLLAAGVLLTYSLLRPS